MKFCTIASGSKGNMTFVSTKATKIVIDAGISHLEAKKRLAGKDIDLQGLSAVLITHEHGDHVKFLVTFLKKTQAHLYISALSYQKLDEEIKQQLTSFSVHFMEANKRYQIGDLEFLTLKLSHDSVDILGFVFIEGSKRLAYVADTGFFPLHYLDLLKEVDGLIIESNHDVEMLLESDRSTALKERILSPFGHMSNFICQQILSAVINDRHRVILLAHISEECNDFALIKRDIIDSLPSHEQLEIRVAGQWEASKVYEL
ncbi:MAG TPA: MBL fold metallo-hydrolase [Bacilli bacterium]|nr:MAG: putative metallo-hydrolase YycJ [Tenericutes bacterium ADurb.BinA124]HNZ49940.1 MBL fold metallo-hydrolase [Bacilli bacterium]HOH18621.1 MBL fold metallo-hydrolase [Bacilli bacterium]HPN60992.1 MBL fold metallo-hydrolase [Bacilli bacterium]HPX83725.1 MBL fold metallo-hydrolase [Bacilli bacterium]